MKSSLTEIHEKNMALALEEARLALEEGEFPVGCVLMAGEQVLARSRRKNSRGDNTFELDHAEIVALNDLFNKAPETDRSTITAYSTMEPCLMCFSTLLLNNITKIVFAYEDVMGGGTNLDLKSLSPLYQKMQPSLTPNILRTESLTLFQDFFRRPQNTYWQGSPLAQYTLAQK